MGGDNGFSSGWQVSYGWFIQLPAYAAFSVVLLLYVVGENSVIPGIVFASVVGALHIVITLWQTCGLCQENLKLPSVDPKKIKQIDTKISARGRFRVLLMGAVDGVMLALGTSALMNMNCHSGTRGVSEAWALTLKVVIFFLQWMMTFIDLIVLKGFGAAFLDTVPGSPEQTNV